MPNKWIDHVKQWAAANGKSYGCAITDKACKDAYTKVVKKTIKEIRQEQKIINQAQARNQLLNRIKSMTEDEKQVLQMRYNNLNNDIKEDIKKNYSKYYNKLF